MADLTGKRILTILQNRGAEQDEVKQPVEQLRDAGAEVTVATPEAGTIQTLVGDWDLGEQFTSDTTLSEVDDSGYDILVVPGGTLNADSLRLRSEERRVGTECGSWWWPYHATEERIRSGKIDLRHR